jgi:glycosyltransferase involved in cell wall biosynthesis
LNKQPRVSVLMTVFNADHHLGESLASLRQQEFKDFEVIVLEHGSTDKSLKILEAWDDHRLVLKTLERNIGRTQALNDCFSRANGEYIAILDADDLAHPLRLDKEVQFLNENTEVGLVGTWCQFIDDLDEEVGSSRPPVSHEKLIRQMAVRDPIVHSSMMFRRNIAVEIGGYDTSFVYAQDFNLLIEFARRTKIAVINEELCVWRRSKSSLTASNELKITRAYDEFRLFKKVSASFDLGRVYRLLNLKQRMLTAAILMFAIRRSNLSVGIRKWSLQHGDK